MRVKETADDYRMFPDPDLAPFDLSDEFIEGVRAELPELPDEKRDRFIAEHGLPKADAEAIAGDVAMAELFDTAAAGLEYTEAKKLANIILNDLSAWANENNATVAGLGASPAHIASLAKLLAADTISSKQGKEVIAAIIADDVDPETYVEEHGMKQTTDTGAIEQLVEQLMQDNPDKVAAYRGGKKGLQGFFMGQIMKAMKGQGNPKVISQIVTDKLEG